MARKIVGKTTKKPQRSRLTHEEKLEVCKLLGSGHSMNEVSEMMTKKAKKPVGLWQVRHYFDSPKWGAFIRLARKDDLLHAEKIPVFSTTGRIKKYDKLLGIFEKKFYESLQNIEADNLNPENDPGTFKFFNLAASYILKILREVREEEFEALAKKSSGHEEEIEDFFAMVERRIIISRKQRDPDRELEKAAGLL